jgi:cytochrome c5
MSTQPTPHDREPRTSFIKTPRQLVTIVVLAFVVPVVLIILVARVVVSMRAPDPAVLAPETVAKRIKPVADVAIQAGGGAPAANAPAPAAIVPAPSPPSAPVASAAGRAADGKAVYDRACVACHQAGVAGAPKLGDKAGWAPRIAQGMDTLYMNSLKGKGTMPPKGGQTALPDADVKAAVDYLVGAAK